MRVEATNGLDTRAIGETTVTVTGAYGIPVTATYKATADTFIFKGQPTQNFGSWAFQYMGLGDLYRGLVKFDVSDINPAYPVDKAVVSVYVDVLKNGQEGHLSGSGLTTGWAENTATWKVPWTTAGGDFAATEAGSTHIMKADEGSWKEVDITALVQAWVADPTSNRGVILRLLNATNNNTILRTSTNNYWYPDYGAKLIVTYRKP